MAALPLAEARAAWLAAIAPRPPRRLALAEGAGLVLAEDLRAPHDLPPFPRAMMDGYAVRLADAGAERLVAGAVHAGDPPGVLPPEVVLAIMTGAPVPAGAEAVVPHERCIDSDGAVRVPGDLRPGLNLVPQGGEARAGAVVLPAGRRLTPLALAVAAAIGCTELAVIPRPRAAIRCTGSELVGGGGELVPGTIRDSNGPMLAALCAELGIAAAHGVVADHPDAVAAAVVGAAADLLILSGGVSAGDRDFVPGALRALGYRILVQGVEQKPGKPLLLAAPPAAGGPLVAALPGNPLAVHWCFTAVVAPALRRLAGLPDQPRRSRGVLAAALPGSRDRTWFVPARAEAVDGAWRVTPLPPASSADVVGPAAANAYLAVPAGASSQAPGTAVEILWCGAAAWEP